MLRFPVFPLCHRHVCRSSTLAVNIRRLNLFLILQRSACSPPQIPFTPIHPRPPLFTVLIHIRYRPLHYYPLHTHTWRRWLRKKNRLLRADDGVDRHGWSIFVLGWREGQMKNRKLATPMLGVSSAEERRQHHRVLEPIPLLATWPSVWWCLWDLQRRPYLLHLRKAARHC